MNSKRKFERLYAKLSRTHIERKGDHHYVDWLRYTQGYTSQIRWRYKRAYHIPPNTDWSWKSTKFKRYIGKILLKQYKEKYPDSTLNNKNE